MGSKNTQRSNARKRSMIVRLKKVKEKTDVIIMVDAMFVALKSSLFTSVVIFLGALVPTVLALFLYDKQIWTSFTAYIIASVLLFLVLTIVWFKPQSKILKVINVLITSLLGFIASIDLLKIISNLVLFNKYGETPLDKVPSIFIDSATFSNPYHTLVFSILTVFVFMFFYHLSITYCRAKNLQKKELLLKEKHLGYRYKL
ncbi:hypothetical protein [Shewanella sp. S1-58-MNA-CIBAN-0166]|uniref:hypothetical protein n=1 Tax=Shewanella sp. S1-58-MNA-CIBAN-0166 TaxID=3140467 RepID=UPI003326E45A